MNHPHIKTRDLSDETIKALMDVLYDRHARERDAKDRIGIKQSSAALAEAKKLQRFLDK